MFGFTRTALALLVMAFHLLDLPVAVGAHAVFGFYVISGYLMTYVMHRSYGYDRVGRWRFAVNRVLRLYPAYWCGVALSVGLILWFGSETVADYHEAITLPDSLSAWASNALMIFPAVFPNRYEPRLVPPAWALTVEITFYTLIALGVSKSSRRVKWWLGLSAVYVLLTFALGLPWRVRYFPVFAASLPFAVGAWVYFARNAESPKGKERTVWVARRTPLWFALLLGNCGVWALIDARGVGLDTSLGLYAAVAFAALLVWGLAAGGEVIRLPKGADKAIGTYSYPIYLFHWQAGLVVTSLIAMDARDGGVATKALFLVFALVVAIALSAAINRWVDEPIQTVRTALRPQAPDGARERSAV